MCRRLGSFQSSPWLVAMWSMSPSTSCEDSHVRRYFSLCLKLFTRNRQLSERQTTMIICWLSYNTGRSTQVTFGLVNLTYVIIKIICHYDYARASSFLKVRQLPIGFIFNFIWAAISGSVGKIARMSHHWVKVTATIENNQAKSTEVSRWLDFTFWWILIRYLASGFH